MGSFLSKLFRSSIDQNERTRQPQQPPRNLLLMQDNVEVSNGPASGSSSGSEDGAKYASPMPSPIMDGAYIRFSDSPSPPGSPPASTSCNGLRRECCDDEQDDGGNGNDKITSSNVPSRTPSEIRADPVRARMMDEHMEQFRRAEDILEGRATQPLQQAATPEDPRSVMRTSQANNGAQEADSWKQASRRARKALNQRMKRDKDSKEDSK